MSITDPWVPPDYRDDEIPPDDEASIEQADYATRLEMAVGSRLHSLRVEELARARLAAEKAGPAPPFDAGTLSELLDRGPTPSPRVEDLIPADAGTLVVAQRKTGKTTFELNLARSLILGEDFLGRFGVQKVTGNVGLLNFEVSGHQISRWAHDHQVPDDRLFIVNLRGSGNPFKQPDRVQLLAELLRRHEVETLLVDPFGRAYPGDNQNDPGEVGSWLQDLDAFARESVGATDVILSAHAGWKGERTRGSSALEDWADSIITMTRDKYDDQKRFLKAEGRDVLIEEDALAHDPINRTLTLTGTGSRHATSHAQRIERLVDHVRTHLTHTPDQSGNQLDEHLATIKDTFGLTHSKGDGAKAARILIDQGEATSEKRGNSTRFNLISPDSPELPTGNSETSLTSPVSGEVSKGSRNSRPPHEHKETA